MINKPDFFEKVKPLFKKFSQSQVDGLNFLLDYWEKNYDTNDKIERKKFAYILATVFHETAQTIQPIEEYGKGEGRRYGSVDKLTGEVYYGRGYVQITWDYNYKKLGELIGVDLYHKPKLALQPEYAVQILFIGMEFGLFTGKKLEHYFNEETTDAVNARRIVNGTDKAELIAGYYDVFLQAISSKISFTEFLTKKYVFGDRDFSDVKVPYAQIIADVNEWYGQNQ